MADLKIAFQQFDKNSDGYISKQELSEAMTNLGHIISNEELDQIIKAVDVDGKIALHSIRIVYILAKQIVL